jgi:hypothetical protein
VRSTERVPKVAASEYKRYARLPHDRAVEDMRHEWVTSVEWHQAMNYVLPEIELGAHLVIGEYRRRRYALLYLSRPVQAGWPTAVTGWGPRPQEALSELSFKWLVLMRQSWDPVEHAKLVTEGGIRKEWAQHLTR